MVKGDEVRHLPPGRRRRCARSGSRRPAEHQARAHRQRRGADLGHDDRQHHHTDAQQHGDDEGPPAEEAEGKARVVGERQAERAPDVPHLVQVVQDQRRRDPVRHQHHGGDGEGQDPGAGQRRDSPPLLHATQSRAYGRARRRGLGIGWKQRSQYP